MTRWHRAEEDEGRKLIKKLPRDGRAEKEEVWLLRPWGAGQRQSKVKDGVNFVYSGNRPYISIIAHVQYYTFLSILCTNIRVFQCS